MKLEVGGVIRGSTFNLTAGAGKIAADALEFVTLSTSATVNMLEVRGKDINGDSISGGSMLSVNTFGSIVLHDVGAISSGTITADKIGSYTRFDGATRIGPLLNLDAAGTPDQNAGGIYKLVII